MRMHCKRNAQISVFSQTDSYENLKSFRLILHEDNHIKSKIEGLRLRVADFASGFPLPGMEDI
ncbi:Serine hydroxymethyltransferase [Schistosoma japonicum]|nr:Serine hydroxymethyltransferase [Schistosoma japonicum]